MNMKRVMMVMVVMTMTMVGFTMSSAASAGDRNRGLDVDFEFSNTYVAGIERKRFAHNIDVTGWQLADKVYFGKTKIADRSAVGFVFKTEKTVFNVTHRGVQITRYF